MSERREPTNRLGNGHGALRTSASEAEQLLANASPRQVEPPYRDRRNNQKLRQREDEHDLRKKVATFAYLGMSTQILIADLVFVLYAWQGREWDVPIPAIAAWLSATVVQVIAVLLVITRYLFPPRKGKRG